MDAVRASLTSKLTEAGPITQHPAWTGGYLVEPVDIHAAVRHLDCIQDYITLTDKPIAYTP